ncbi:MAG: AAA family ATPase [Lachnospiraceae bacterium]|nr:AAA family ATPase [Lachnospiraceae bacterium]
MVIDKLYLNDFRGIHELELDLQGKSTVLYGINGVGKSSVLAAINLMYANIINRLVKQRFKQSMKAEESDIKYKKAIAEVGADFRFEDEQDIFPYFLKIYRKGNAKLSLSKDLTYLVRHYEDLYIKEDQVDENNNLISTSEDSNIPIFVNYGVNRLVLKTPLRIRKKESYGQFTAFEKAIENQIAFDKLFEWFLEQELYETQRQKIEPKYEDIPLKAVKSAMLAMLDGYSNVHITARPYSMKVYKGSDVLDILQLSDGEKCTLALFGDLARRLAIANPSSENPLEGKGVVLIDEIELHMHTSWQRKVISVLKKTFPNIQFIITTHSPQVLGEIDDDFNVFALEKVEEDVLCHKYDGFFGVDSNAVLEEAFQTESVNLEVKDKVKKMYDFIEEKKYEDAEEIIREIEHMTRNRNRDTVRGRVLIRKGKKVNASNT